MTPTVPPWSRRVAKLRRDRGLTQTELAEMAGVHQTTISYIERGGRPDDTTKLRVATALDLTADDLFPVAEVAVS